MGPSGNDRSVSLNILVIATEWDSRHGGLSTFNRELCRASRALGHQVFCLVPSARPDEIANARATGVTLLVAGDAPGLSDETRLSAFQHLPDDQKPDVIIGHGRVTGQIAKILTDRHQNSHRVHFVHVAPGAIEWFKDQETPATERAEDREKLEVSLARSAELVAAVGPLLQREISVLLTGFRSDVLEFHPGLGELRPPVIKGPGAQCLVLGRAEDAPLKGLDIAARAFALLDHSTPPRPVLMVRGAPPGKGDELRRRLLELAGNPGLDIRVRSFSADVDQIAQDLAQASVMLMPSRSEGFGLVGLEGIAAGLPVLLSDRSGLAELMTTLVPDIAEAHVVPVSGDLERDGPVWARKISWILRNRDAAVRRATDLRERLAPLLSWRESAARMFNALPTKGPTRPAPAKRGANVIVLPTTRSVPEGPACGQDRISVADLTTVQAWGWNDVRLQQALHELDYETMAGLTDEHSGLVEQWGPVFSEHPESWRLLYTQEGELIGYWHFVTLFPNDHESARNGRLLDIDITADRVQAFEIPGTYDIYFAGICIRPEYRRPKVMKTLLWSLLSVLESLAREEVFVGEVCANAFTPGGAAICKSLGMRPHVKHLDHGEVYLGRLADMLGLQLAQSFGELRSLYGARTRQEALA